MIWQVGAQKDTAGFLAFLDHLLASLPVGPLVIALDNVGYHKSHAARAWWAAHAERVQPFWLPAYTPELNLTERVWRHLKDKLSNHRWWADLPALERATAALLDRMTACFHRQEGITLQSVQDFCASA